MHSGGTQSARDEGGAAGVDAIDAREGALIVGQVIESMQRRAIAVVRTTLRHKRAGGQIAPTTVQLRAEDQQQSTAETAENVDPQQEIAQDERPNRRGTAVDLHHAQPKTELADRAPVEGDFFEDGKEEEKKRKQRNERIQFARVERRTHQKTET